MVSTTHFCIGCTSIGRQQIHAASSSSCASAATTGSSGPARRGSAMNQHSWSPGSVLSGILLGFAVALVYCWFTWARPMQTSLDACEKSLQEWAKINISERQNASAIKDLSVDELRRWVATLDEQNQRFMALERLVHQQELDLIGPATSYLLIAACVVFGVVILLV